MNKYVYNMYVYVCMYVCSISRSIYLSIFLQIRLSIDGMRKEEEMKR